MNNFYLLFIVILFLQFNTRAQEGWFEQTFDTTLSFKSVHFVSESTGWIVGGEYGGQGYIYKTTNGGNDWQKQIGDTISMLFSIDFDNENDGCAVGEDGTILMTTNGGEIWHDKSFDNHPLYTSVQFTGENTCYASGLGKIIKTTNGGDTWEVKIDTLTGYDSNISFINSDVGWILDNGDATIYKTTDGGGNWNLPVQVSGCCLWNIFFINDSIGWHFGAINCVCGDGILRKTTDGGMNWEDQLNLPWGITSAFFADENVGWLVHHRAGIDTSYCEIFNTTNGGEDWILQLSLLSIFFTNLISIYFINENYGWSVGSNGLILHTINGGVSFIEANEIDELPSDYSLTQNYPNPFNPSTKIEYSIPHTSNVVIKVVDILGNEIETLVHEEKPTGTYELTWDAANLPSGIYFYQLRAVDPSTGSGQVFIQTKKMILLK